MKDIDYTAYLKGSLRLSATGDWWHNGVQFKNSKLSSLFSRSIVFDEETKEFFVKIGRQRATFDLEDSAYFVVLIDDSKLPWEISLSDGTTEELNPKGLATGTDSQIYCQVKEGRFWARFHRTSHQTLLEHVIDESSILIGDEKFKINLRTDQGPLIDSKAGEMVSI